MMVSTKTLHEVTNKSKFDWIISINGLTRFFFYYCSQRTQDSGRMNLFVCPIFLLWSKGLFNITEKTITVLGNEPRKKERLKRTNGTCYIQNDFSVCWMTIKHSKIVDMNLITRGQRVSLSSLHRSKHQFIQFYTLIGRFPDVSQIDNFNLLNMKVCSLVDIWHNMANYCSINFFYKPKIFCVREVPKLERNTFSLNQIISNFKISLANMAERLTGRPNKLSSVLIISLICYT